MKVELTPEQVEEVLTACRKSRMTFRSGLSKMTTTAKDSDIAQSWRRHEAILTGIILSLEQLPHDNH